MLASKTSARLPRALRDRTPVVPRRMADVAMVVLGVLGFAAILWLARGWDLFFVDEWGTIFYRRSGGIEAFLAPSNGHFQAVLIAVYRVLFATAGLEHYLPYRIVILAAHLAVVALFYLYARTRVQPEVALVAAVLVLMFGAGAEAILWAINLGFVLPLAALMAVLLLWNRTGKGPAVARTLLLLVAITSSALGVAVVVAVVVEALWRGDRWRRLIEPGIPFVLWAAWFLLYRPTASTPAALREIPGANPDGDVGGSFFDPPSVGQALSYFGELAQAGANGFLRLDPLTPAWAAIGVLVAIGAVLVKRPSIRQRVLTLTAGLSAYWLSLAVGRGEFESGPVAGRYLYVAAVFLGLIAIECMRGLKLPRVALPVLAILTAVVVAAEVRTFESVGNDAAKTFTDHRVGLRQINRPTSREGIIIPVPAVAPGPYRAATAELGYPAGTAP